jgi:hypothetical protein
VRLLAPPCQDERRQAPAGSGRWEEVVVQSGVVPLRPLTVGEVLDAAVGLFRTHARVFLVAGLLLAVAEQAVLYPLRTAASTEPPFLLPYDDRLAQYWIMLAVGFGTETAIISLLAGLTSRAAGPALLGERVSGRQLLALRGSRLGAVALIAVAAGVLGLLGALACWVPWIAMYGAVGLIVPTLVIDRTGPFRAMGRGLVLALRGALRACGVRLAGYVGWWAVRVALGIGSIALLSLALDDTDPKWLWLSAVIAWSGVNAVAYPALACLDAVLHLETRMRTEGLDIAVTRSRATGRPPAAELVVP